MKKIPILAALILLLISLTAAEEWMSFTTDDGLAHDVCRCVAVDHDGNVWVGHGDAFSGEGGVSMWDGETWTTYYSWTTDFGLRSNYIHDIAVDQDNNIWFGTGTVLFDGGLTKFDGENWTSYALDTLVDWGIRWVNDIDFDGNGVLWGAMPAGAINFDGDTFIWFSSAHGLPDDVIQNVAIDNANVKWFATRRGLYSYDDLSFRAYDTSDGLYSLRTWDVFVEDTSLLLSYYHDNVLSEFNDSTWIHYDSSDGLTGAHLQISVDNSGTYYLGSSYEGIFRRFSSSGSLFTNISILDGDPATTIWDITVDEWNNKYFVNGSGLYVYNEDSIVWNIRESPIQATSPSFDIYPNPFTHEVCFSSDEFQNFYIYDIQGKQIEALNGRSVKWKPKDLSSGVYFVKVNMLEKEVTKKIFYTR